MDERVTVESLEKFVTGFENEELVPYLKSGPLPDNEGKAVKEVVGKTFYDLVIANKRDVMIMFYSPSCAYCKQLSPIWEQLAQAMKDEPNIHIVKMDATMNDVPKPFEVISYPSIYWIPSGDKGSSRKYDGMRQLDEFIIYISQFATYELINYDREGELRNEKLDL